MSGSALFASFLRYCRPKRREIYRFAAGTTFSLALLIGSVNDGGNAVANGDSRTISLYHTHTGESLTIEYKRNGSFDRDALEKLNWFLRDYHRDEPTSMDPRLFDIVWEAQRQVGSSEPINVVSAYRSPETNAMLRRRSKAVAKNSQHMLGKAMDFYLTDANITQIREVALKMQRGGVGYYPNAFTPFVHLDAGSVRHWPRMSHDELVRLFPDGKTVHIPADGRPLERYAEAEQEILANGGTVMGASYADAGENAAPEPKTKSFWAALFGGGGSEDEDSEVVTQKPVQRFAATKSAAPVSDMSDTGDTSAENTAPEPKAALPKLPSVVAMPALSSFHMAVLAPHAPFPPSRPGAPVASLVVMASTGPQLVWQTGAQALGGAPVPLPPLRNGMAAAAMASLSSQPVPLPPMRGQTGRNGTPLALAVPDGAEITASLSGNRSEPALPKIIADGRRPAPSGLALAYVATVPASSAVSDDASNTLPANAVAASKLALSGKSTGFSSTEDLGPPPGHFSKKSPAACRAGKSGQPCMPSAER